MKPIVIVSAGLILGVGIGAGGIGTGMYLGSKGHDEPAPTPDVIAREPRVEPRDGVSRTSLPVSGEKVVAERAPIAAPEIESLGERLDAEKSSRLRLEKDVARLRQQVLALSRTVAMRAPGDVPPELPSSIHEQDDAAKVDESRVQTFVAAGFEPATAETISRRLDEIALDRLYLRDQAAREGWLATARYRQEVRRLADKGEALRGELTDEDYDRYLYATGQANRVSVHGVLGGSSAQVAGIEPGDAIFSYDGRRIYSSGDLRDATTSGVPGDTVMVEIIREGERLEVNVPRGPLGVELRMVAVNPSLE